jgi:hypothetical protein
MSTGYQIKDQGDYLYLKQRGKLRLAEGSSRVYT